MQPLLQHILLILCCSYLNLCSAADTITIYRSIKDPESIVSEAKNFKLGFFSPDKASNHRYVGVMYNIPLDTVVWVANRGKPINGSSGTVTISEDGNLVVSDGDKTMIWSSNVVSDLPRANLSAQLMDTGNLVLRDNSSGRVLWESFREPTDTFLQMMQIGQDPQTKVNNQLTSWKSPSDPSLGDFRVGIEPLSIPQIVIWKGNRTYWRSGPWNDQIFIGIRDMVALYRNDFTVTDDKVGSAYMTFNYVNSSLYLYFKINSSGFLTEEYWEEVKENWIVTWSAQINACDVYGICGPFGICNPNDSPICTCLHGFEPEQNDEWSRGNWSAGCRRMTELLPCERKNSIDGNRKPDGFVKLPGVKIPDFAELFLVYKDECESKCLSNCSCKAYSYHVGIGCMYWSRNLLDIQQFSTGGEDLYIRLAYSEFDHSKDVKLLISATVTISSIIIIICGYFLWKWLARRKGNKQIAGLLSPTKGSLNLVQPYGHLPKFDDLPLFDFEMVSNATNGFHLANKLGRGGFGTVYMGKLPEGQEIAVKRLSKSSGQGQEEFMNEVVVISRLQHRNLVRLLGCCIEGEEKMLIYEFMPNRCLDSYLFDSEKEQALTWSQCKGIIEGIGRGLLYLHRDSRLKIIHRDLKVSNILLDKEMNPKISDFGMARIFGGNQDQADTTRVVGTYGYMAPEYAMEGRFSEKSDVYSFGVILLELISGRKNTSFCESDEAVSLLGYAWKLWNDDEIIKIIDEKVFDQHFRPEIVRYIQIGLLCVEEFAADRPTVSTILSMLSSEITDLPSPKLPGFIGRHNQQKYSVNDLTISIVEGR